MKSPALSWLYISVFFSGFSRWNHRFISLESFRNLYMVPVQALVERNSSFNLELFLNSRWVFKNSHCTMRTLLLCIPNLTFEYVVRMRGCVPLINFFTSAIWNTDHSCLIVSKQQKLVFALFSLQRLSVPVNVTPMIRQKIVTGLSRYKMNFIIHSAFHDIINLWTNDYCIHVCLRVQHSKIWIKINLKCQSCTSKALKCKHFG
jgi:hypothetical protein